MTRDHLTKRQQLQNLQKVLQGSGTSAGEVISLDLAGLEELLPMRRLSPGGLVEWWSDGEGAGAWTMALLAAKELQRQGFLLVLIDPTGEFYPPGAFQLGIDLERLIVVRPLNGNETLWSLEQSLRSAARVVVMADLHRLPSSTYRRLKLAAERGGNIGFLLRPQEVRGDPSWADVRLLVEPVSTGLPNRTRRLKVTLLSARGSEWRERSVVLDISDEADVVSVVSGVDRAEIAVHVPRAS